MDGTELEVKRSVEGRLETSRVMQARRKRREIRLLKMVARTTSPSDNLSGQKPSGNGNRPLQEADVCYVGIIEILKDDKSRPLLKRRKETIAPPSFCVDGGYQQAVMEHKDPRDPVPNLYDLQLATDLTPADMEEDEDPTDPPPLLSTLSVGKYRLGVCPPHAVMNIVGRRREMEDEAIAVPFFLCLPCPLLSFHFFAVYDGHGGAQVARFCKEQLHQKLAEEVKAVSRSVNMAQVGTDTQERENLWRKAMVSCFLKVDEEIGAMFEGKSTGTVVSGTMGSTAIVSVISSNHLIVGNCGDSRAVLSRGGQAIALSNDHKPEREDEMDRIERAGGRVICREGHRVMGMLSMSRAIGDVYLKPYVIAEPDVTCIGRSEQDECLILASDGLWDVVSNETACQVARRCLRRRWSSKDMMMVSEPPPLHEEEELPVSAAAAMLTKLALARGSSDNVSVVVIDLRRIK